MDANEALQLCRRIEQFSSVNYAEDRYDRHFQRYVVNVYTDWRDYTVLTYEGFTTLLQSGVLGKDRSDT